MDDWALFKVSAYGKRVKSRRQILGTKMYPLKIFRQQKIPRLGLWSHYFWCPQCRYERRNPRIRVCPYCDVQMIECGRESPFAGVRSVPTQSAPTTIVNGIPIYQRNAL